jgi:hypothetical protein
MTYVTWGWPILLIVGALDAWQVEQTALWHRLLDNAGFAYMLCAVAALATFVIDKSRHERAMARLFGVREGDERERTVTGDAARTTLLLSLALQIVLLLLSLTTVKLVWNAAAPKGTPHGLLAVGFQFSSSDQLSAFKLASSAAATATGEPGRVIVNGYVLPPATFPVLLALILLQIASFKAFSRRRYEGMDA